MTMTESQVAIDTGNNTAPTDIDNNTAPAWLRTIITDTVGRDVTLLPAGYRCIESDLRASISWVVAWHEEYAALITRLKAGDQFDTDDGADLLEKYGLPVPQAARERRDAWMHFFWFLDDDEAQTMSDLTDEEEAHADLPDAAGMWSDEPEQVA